MNKVKTAVIVDDNPPTRTLIFEVLNGIGIKDIVQAINGEDAIAKIRETSPHLVIMDWKMDVMDGLECTQRIRSGIDGIDQKIPIVLLTGMVGADAEKKAYEAGVDLFLEKPFSIKKLHSGIIKILGPA
ncbi:response regulator [Paramagnetospirillum magnetotacticum]|uniref:response regulator n=1 Tax=Paramagnetospirillum magnetotacticum TaxID=188 RepID=UPI0006961279|nr:response regulator [Paramagnetospirillum magnetotacticum]